MSQVLSRVMLAVALLFAAPVVCTTIIIVLDKTSGWDDERVLTVANLATCAAFGACWVLIWRRQVRWTFHRRTLTMLSVLGATGVAFGVFGIICAFVGWADEAAIVLAALAWPPAWIALTAYVWRETPMERAGRLKNLAPGGLACPQCGYNLTGLRQARCPECGTQFTLDELFASLTTAEPQLQDH